MRRKVWTIALGVGVLFASTAAVAWALRPRTSEPLPIYTQVPHFSLTTQAGTSFSEQNLLGHVTVVDFIFTRCPTACPVMTERMRALQRQAEAKKIDLHFLSISVDPRYDTPARLKQYADSHGANTKSWSFLTGTVDAIEQTASDGFRIMVGGDVDAGEEDYLSILHGDYFVLVDDQANIRGYYSVVKDPRGLDKLLVDAAQLSSRSTLALR
jgi:protein SCO1/2